MDYLALIDSVDLDIIKNTLTKVAQFQSLIKGLLKEGQDYGKIPGTNKPTLYQAGAQKVNMAFGINPQFTILDKIINTIDGIYIYEIKCELLKNNQKIAEGIGSCSSMEKKYRYITRYENQLSDDEKLTAIKIESNGKIQYKINNPDPADLQNTILKMAKKRSYVDATLQVAALGDIFTQDVEDINLFMEKEIETMTIEEAANFKITFGKQKGKTLKELYKSDISYINWLRDNIKPDQKNLKRAIDILDNEINNKSSKSKTLADRAKEKINQQDDKMINELDDLDGLPFSDVGVNSK